MGLMSWFKGTAKKSAAAANIKHYFEICQRHGLFPYDPAKVANHVVEIACEQIEGFEENRYNPLVFASGALGIAITELDEPAELRNHYAMALAAMMKAALEGDRLSMGEEKLLDAAHRILTKHEQNKVTEVRYGMIDGQVIRQAIF